MEHLERPCSFTRSLTVISFSLLATACGAETIELRVHVQDRWGEPVARSAVQILNKEDVETAEYAPPSQKILATYDLVTDAKGNVSRETEDVTCLSVGGGGCPYYTAKAQADGFLPTAEAVIHADEDNILTLLRY